MFEKLGKFHIKRVLGQGAMGEVYLGEDPSIGREVAIKTILPSTAQGEEARERFAREAKAAGVLNHPNLVTIYEFGEDQGVMYIAMEMVPGHDLQELLQDQSLSRSEALEVLGQVCDGLDFAHRQGIVHRDIKPSNIRVQRDGKKLRAKVMDFGVARVANSDMTGTGIVMGTVSYMAPEYIRSGRPDPRSDLFAVGVILYEALSGRKPFSGDTTPTILYKIVNEPPEPIDLSSLEGISPLVRGVLDKGLAKNPDERYQTAEAFAKALRAAKDPTWLGQIPEATTVLHSGSAGHSVPFASEPTALLPSGTAAAAASQDPTAGTGLPPPVPATAPRPAQAAPAKSGSGVLMGLLLAAAAVLALVAGGGYMGWRWWQARQGAIAQLPPATSSDPRAAAGAPNVELPKPLESAPPSDTKTVPDAPARLTPANPVLKPKGSSPQVSGPAPALPVSPESPREAPREAPPSGPFSPERLSTLSSAEHISLSNTTLSEATALAGSNPAKALEGLRNALAANPYNSRAYAWALVVSYNSSRFGEMKSFYRQARGKGISLSQLESSNAQLKTILDNEAFNHRIPGGLEGHE